MSADKKPIVWSIAGSDSGGGAGIQADLATLSNLGCHGCSVITTLTAQSSVAVTLTEAVSEEMLLAQLNALLGDLPPKAIKIGLLANQAQLQQLCDWLARHLPDVPLVVDPVMVASCGDALSKSTATGAARLDYRPLAALSTVLTPNIHELALLSRSDIHDFSSWQDAATCLANELPCHLLAKGGDFEAGSRAVWQKTYCFLKTCLTAPGCINGRGLCWRAQDKHPATTMAAVARYPVP